MLARRLAAYEGVMRARLIELEQAEQGGGTPASGQRRDSAPVRVADTTALAELDDVFER